MLYLDRTYNPVNNEKMMKKYFDNTWSLREAVKETEQLFEKLKASPCPEASTQNQSLSFGQVVKNSLISLVAKRTKARRAADWKAIIDENGMVQPGWKRLLDQELQALNRQMKQMVNVTDYGAIGDGKTDNTKAFEQAIGSGQVYVEIPAGKYIVQGIRLPSWTKLIGEGKGKTIIKLHDKAPKRTRLITNANHIKGNHHVYVEGMSLDWNIERLGNVEKTSSGNNFSSCLTYANVTYGWVKEVEGINPGLHSFDISSTYYDYSGDGFRARGGSKYVWLDRLTGYGFGDDGITTHHSTHLLISNSFMCDPSGRSHKRGFSNSNGFEVDDGSEDVWLVNNISTRCFGGVEAKAHHNSSAARNVHIYGHLSIHDNRSYNFRHIGHHHADDPDSKTAYDIQATGLVAIAPVYTDLYKSSTPRALVVSAYRHVMINHFAVIGDPEYDYKGNPVLAVQYRARKIYLKNIFITGFKTADAAIKVFGGSNKADCIKLDNVMVQQPGLRAVEVGQGVQNVEY